MASRVDPQNLRTTRRHDEHSIGEIDLQEPARREAMTLPGAALHGIPILDWPHRLFLERMLCLDGPIRFAE
jgi:hypothetical protein